MKLKTNKLLLSSIIILVLVFLSFLFSDYIGLRKEGFLVLAVLIIIAFGLNIIGLILVFTERKNNHKASKVGLVGHLILMIGMLILGYFAIGGFALLMMN